MLRFCITTMPEAEQGCQLNTFAKRTEKKRMRLRSFGGIPLRIVSPHTGQKRKGEPLASIKAVLSVINLNSEVVDSTP